ncbi:hypothetical protein HW130_14000 [Streptomyces sp. PKU-EA00015]|nr:hypothetical protein [Streptomyces sp. PKU-EA00015]NWF27371.1 hypothetical protein [Streptomyces sp. PKU-EA00015]
MPMELHKQGKQPVSTTLADSYGHPFDANPVAVAVGGRMGSALGMGE